MDPAIYENVAKKEGLTLNEKPVLVSQKLLKPFIHEKIIQRLHLIKSIGESKSGIVYIVAPAGFGKTVLLSQLSEVFNQPAV